MENQTATQGRRSMHYYPGLNITHKRQSGDLKTLCICIYLFMCCSCNGLSLFIRHSHIHWGIVNIRPVITCSNSKCTFKLRVISDSFKSDTCMLGSSTDRSKCKHILDILDFLRSYLYTWLIWWIIVFVLYFWGLVYHVLSCFNLYSLCVIVIYNVWGWYPDLTKDPSGIEMLST